MFFYSANKKFVIKTLRGDEKEKMLSMLDEYIDHLEVTTKNQSLLARVYGIYTIKSKLLQNVDLIIMQNTAIMLKEVPKSKKLEFDLKGSRLGRKNKKFHPEHLRYNEYYSRTLKDLNFLDIQQFYEREFDVINLTTQQHNKILRITNLDSKFLRS